MLFLKRDHFKDKSERLNTQLNFILGADDRRLVDIDSVLMENRSVKIIFKIIVTSTCMHVDMPLWHKFIYYITFCWWNGIHIPQYNQYAFFKIKMLKPTPTPPRKYPLLHYQQVSFCGHCKEVLYLFSHA